MGWMGAALGGLAGAGRGYEASRGRNIPGPTPGQQGPLMKYLQRRQNSPTRNAAQVGTSAPGLPPGAMPPPMSQQTPPVGAPPMVGPPPGGPMMPQMSPMDQDGSQDPNAPIPMPGGAAPPVRPDQREMMAQGEVVTRPTTAVLGEDGPEMVVPLSGQPGAKVSTANLSGGMAAAPAPRPMHLMPKMHYRGHMRRG